MQGNYSGPEQCPLAWVFVNELFIDVNMVSCVKSEIRLKDIYTNLNSYLTGNSVSVISKRDTDTACGQNSDSFNCKAYGTYSYDFDLEG